MEFKNLTDMSSPTEHDFSYEEKDVVWLRVVEVKMPFSCSPKAKAIQSRVRKQNNCPSFGNKILSSRIATDQESFVSI